MNTSLQILKYTPKCPMPERIRTKFTAALQGYVAAGVGFQTYNVFLNRPTFPFSVGSAGGITAFPNPDNPIATLNPTYWSYLYTANSYQSYRVISSSLKVQLKTFSILDAIWCCVTPCGNYANLPASVQVAQAQPRCKWKLFDTYGTNMIRNQVKYHELLGVSESAIIDDLSGNYTGRATAAPSTLAGWIINWETAGSAVTANQIGYDVEVSYYVELWNLNYGGLVEN